MKMATLAVSFSMIALSARGLGDTDIDATVVFLVSAMSTDPSGATAPRKACGRIHPAPATLGPGRSPIHRAASAWPAGTVLTPQP